jgi:hypothetical protein
MMAIKELSPGTNQGTKTGVLSGNQRDNSLIISTSPFVYNFENLHKFSVYADVVNHPWTTVGECCDRLGFHDGSPKNYRHRKLIGDCFSIFEFFGIFRKDYHKYICTGKVPRTSPATHQERVFGSDGLPRVQPKSTATMPGYGRPDCGGEGE